jgi:hypothetical protein
MFSSKMLLKIHQSKCYLWLAGDWWLVRPLFPYSDAPTKKVQLIDLCFLSISIMNKMRKR